MTAYAEGRKPRVHLVAAVRPNIMKIAPLWHALAAGGDFDPVLVHTGQHYDRAMSGTIWDELDLPAPDRSFDVGSGTHAEQIGRVMVAYEALAKDDRPDWLIVPGDVNSSLACAIAGARLGIPLVHLEAGLRSGDRAMPEEQNRILIDALADVHWTPSPDADANLMREGIPSERITRVGNVMIDSLVRVRPAITAAKTAASLRLAPQGYAVATLHRPANVDDDSALARLVAALIAVQARCPLVFPAHPRLARRLAISGLDGQLEAAGVRLIAPLSYVAFISLVADAALVVTDSGGLQEETTWLGIPCLTLRDTTERPITLTEGSNRLVPPDLLDDAVAETMAAKRKDRPPPRLWDGGTAARCVADLGRRDVLSRRRAPICG